MCSVEPGRVALARHIYSSKLRPPPPPAKLPWVSPYRSLRNDRKLHRSKSVPLPSMSTKAAAHQVKQWVAPEDLLFATLKAAQAREELEAEKAAACQAGIVPQQRPPSTYLELFSCNRPHGLPMAVQLNTQIRVDERRDSQTTPTLWARKSIPPLKDGPPEHRDEILRGRLHRGGHYAPSQRCRGPPSIEPLIFEMSAKALFATITAPTRNNTSHSRRMSTHWRLKHVPFQVPAIPPSRGVHPMQQARRGRAL